MSDFLFYSHLISMSATKEKVVKEKNLPSKK